jgi:DNA-binding IclR family transcriptional regulator
MTSLDRGLRVLQLVRDGGPVRVADVAQELEISRPSAHRLLRALVARDFLRQNESRRYIAAEALLAPPVKSNIGGRLRRAAIPHLAWLAEQTGHSAYLQIRVGPDVRFLASVTVEGGTRDRTGLVTPAHVTSGGRAALAELDLDRLRELYRGTKVSSLDGLRAALEAARRRGYATVQRSDEHLTAVGVAIEGDTLPHGHAAITVSIPSEGAVSADIDSLVPCLREAADRVVRMVQAA